MLYFYYRGRIKMKENQNSRNSNFELMRIVSMFFIVLCHIIGHGQMLEHSSGVLQLILRIISYIGIVHVNSFVLLTGYFQYNKKFSVRKLLKIINQQWFYKVIITLLFVFLGIQTVTKLELFNNLLPFDITGNYWFINCYIVLYILSPFLNRFIEHTNQKEHRRCLLVFLLLFSIIPMLTDGYLVSNTGFTVVQFVLLYLTGAYLHKYPIKNNIHFKYYSKNKRQMIFFILMIFLGILNLSFSISADFLTTVSNPLVQQIGEFYRHYCMRYSNILVIVQSVFYFLYFETLSFKNKKINRIGSYTLAVYLLSDHVFVRQHLYKWMAVDQGRSIASLKYVPYIILWAVIIFAFCVFIEIARVHLFEFIKRRKLYQKLRNGFWNYVKEF